MACIQLTTVRDKTCRRHREQKLIAGNLSTEAARGIKNKVRLENIERTRQLVEASSFTFGVNGLLDNQKMTSLNEPVPPLAIYLEFLGITKLHLQSQNIAFIE